MSITINKSISALIGAHHRLDLSLQAARRGHQHDAGRPLPKGASLGDHINVTTSLVAAKVCGLAVGLGCGISTGGAIKVAAGQLLEDYRLSFMARGRSGTWAQLVSTAATLAAKVGLASIGTAVVAPLVGVAWGVCRWGLAAAGVSRAPRPELSMSARQGQQRPTGPELVAAMARSRARTAAAL